MKTKCQKCGCRDGEQVWKDMRGYVVDGLCKCSCHTEKCCVCEGGDIKVGLLAQDCPCNCHKEEAMEDEVDLKEMKDYVARCNKPAGASAYITHEAKERMRRLIKEVDRLRDKGYINQKMKKLIEENTSLQERIKELEEERDKERSINCCVCNKCGQSHDPKLIKGGEGKMNSSDTELEFGS